MAEQDTELSALEPLEIASGATVGDPGILPDPGAAAAPADSEPAASPAEPVSRTEFEQLKVERDQLLETFPRNEAWLLVLEGHCQAVAVGLACQGTQALPG